MDSSKSVKSIKKNYLYNLAFQIFALITPLITTPYVSRVLLPAGVGQFSFSASLNSYFCLFAALGFSFHAQRSIAKETGNIEKQTIIFWEILVCKLIIGAFIFIIDWILIFAGVFQQYTLLMKIISIEIIGVTFNIAFLFQGKEKFRLIAIRDFLIKIVGIALIFVLVKKPSDLWIYALCSSSTALASSISLWLCLRKDLVRISLKQIKPFRHMLPSLKLFIPTIAISIYTILDKALIGFMIPGEVETTLQDGSIEIVRVADIENGFYAQSEKIIRMGMTVIASLSTVMLPRNSKELASGHENIFYSNINKAIDYVFAIGLPMCLGLICIAFNFSPWFFGEGYEKVPVLIIILALMIIPAGIGNVLGQQCLIPKGEDNKYILVYLSCASLNLILNIILIPIFYSYGAAVASVIAELFASIFLLALLRKNISVTSVIKRNWKVFVSSAAMFSIVFTASFFLKSSILNTVILIISGILIYSILLLVLKHKLLWDFLSKITKKESKNTKE